MLVLDSNMMQIFWRSIQDKHNWFSNVIYLNHPSLEHDFTNFESAILDTKQYLFK